MKRTVQKIITFFVVVLGICCINKIDAKAFTTGDITYINGQRYLYSNGQKVINDFVFDGVYTYYAQADGTPMTNRLTYHPDGVHIIYFDKMDMRFLMHFNIVQV